MLLTTQHSLDFEVAPYENNIDTVEWLRFRVGTCYGLWASLPSSYDILAIDNKKPHNGHFNDVMEWFENSAKRDNKQLRILEIMNDRFRDHLINKRGFVAFGLNNVYKQFN